MKRILYLVSLLVSGFTFSQSLGIEWQKSYGGSKTDLCNFIYQTKDEGYVMSGWTRSPNDGDVTGYHPGTGAFGITTEDNWVVKTNKTGAIEWQKSLGGTDGDAGASITQTSDGGYITLGQAKSRGGDLTGSGQHGSTYNDFWLVKLTSTGSISWSKCFGGSGDDVPGSTVTQTTDGGYIMAGQSNSTNGDVTGNHGNYDCWVVKLNSNGTLQWQKSLGGTGVDYGYEVEQTLDGGYIMSGYTNSNNGDVTGNHGDYDYWVVKLDSNGNIQWQKTFGGTSLDQAYAVEQTKDGGYIVAGMSNSINGDVTGHHGTNKNSDYWVVKMDKNGVLQWQKSLGGTANELAWTVHKAQSGGYMVTGYAKSKNGDVSKHYSDTLNADYWFVKLDDNGTMLMEKSLGGTGNDIAHWSQPTKDGGYILAGESTSNDGDVTGNKGGMDYWVVKLTGEQKVCQTVYSTVNKTSCNGNPFVFNGKTLTKSGVYTDTIKTANQCDSVVTLKLTISSGNFARFTLPVSIEAHANPITLNGTPTGGVYYSSTSGVSGNKFNPSLSGLGTKYIRYYVSNSDGCEDTVTASILVYDTIGNVCTSYDTTFITVTDTLIINRNLSSVNPLTFENTIKIYPNPSTDNLSIDFGANFTAMKDNTLKIFNLSGQELFSTPINTAKTTVPISTWPNGTYIVRLLDKSGTVLEARSIVIQ